MFERIDSRFDVLSQVLEAVHLGSVLSSRIELRAPWALRYANVGNRAGFHVVASGSCWAEVDRTGERIELGPGDVVVFPHGAAHTLGDDPDTLPIELGDSVATLAPGERVALPFDGVGACTTLLCGSYSFAADGSNPLLRGLPDVLHVPAVETRGGVVEMAVKLLALEAGEPGSGSALVVDRLVDLLFVYSLRTWLHHHADAGSYSWFGALQDPLVGPAVRAVHANPAHRWTLDALSKQAGLSRAAFTRRFREAVGEPPLTYVTRWRMTVAADLLEKGGRIAHVAQRVGYDNEFAFAKAFKRVRGVSPGSLRRRTAA